MLKKLKFPLPLPMIFPYDIWYIILPHTTLPTLLICRCVCKNILIKVNHIIKSSRNDLDWNKKRQKKNVLSEDFIREFKDKVFWTGISWNQRLSEDFIREFKDKVNWYRISCNQQLSDSFRNEFEHKWK